MPSVPALQITPAANSLEYPTIRMPAITMDPMATTVAGDEPDRAANSMQANTPAIASPPCRWPTQAMEKRMIRRATPPVVMKHDARTKNGIASSVKWPSKAENSVKATEASELSENQSRNRTEDIPSVTAIGTPITNRPMTIANRRAASIRHRPLTANVSRRLFLRLRGLRRCGQCRLSIKTSPPAENGTAAGPWKPAARYRG